MISPLLANIYLHVLDTEFSRRGLGELVRYADDGVALCRSQAQAGAALDAVGEILATLGLRLHPDKTKVVDLREGREGLDFLGCQWRLQRLLIKKRGRNLRAGQAAQWTEDWLHGQGLYKLLGTIRYPKAA
ncbi:MAG: reverse transcriptase domain-containing protein [Streptosporangiaceae bacterium]